MKSLITLAIATAAVAITLSAHAQQAAPSTAPGASTASATMTDGEVRKVDKEAQKVTLRHGEIRNLEMPGMTMVFKVKDPALLDTVKAGDKVRFHAEKSGGSIMVTEIQVVK